MVDNIDVTELFNISEATIANVETIMISNAIEIHHQVSPIMLGLLKISISKTIGIINKMAIMLKLIQYDKMNFVLEIGFDNINSTSRFSKDFAM